MTISVIIPAYNEEKFIATCLDSVMKQTEKPDEIIVVDNNSTDETVTIAQRYPVKIIQEKKQGMIFARNAGFNAARSEIYARCDSDTILPTNWIQKIKKDFQDQSIDGLTGPIRFFDLPVASQTTFFSWLYDSWMKLSLKGNNVLKGPNMIITAQSWRKVKDEVCIDDKKVHEDIDLSIHMIKNNLKIIQDNTLTVDISARRIKSNPSSFFIEYTWRSIKTLRFHHDNHIVSQS